MLPIFHSKLFAIVMLVVGLIIWFSIRAAKFERRGVAGLETFDSYGDALAIRTGEGCAGVFAIFLAVIGALMLVYNVLIQSPAQPSKVNPAVHAHHRPNSSRDQHQSSHALKNNYSAHARI
jgi:hypothetical protein